MATETVASTRINARIDAETEALLDHLCTGTGHTVSQVVRDAIAVYHAHVQAQRPRPKSKFLALAGTGNSGRTDIASNYKKYVAEALEAKFAKSHPPRPK